jgi:hypothetical protein
MKKILFIIAMVLSVGVQAQTFSSTLTVTGAALSGTDTAYLNHMIDYPADLHFKLTITKTSGTVAGAAILQGSVDNSTWFSVNTDDGIAAASQYQDTATVTNGTASYWWKVQKDNAVYKYYRIRVITSDGVSTASGVVYAKK